MIKVMIFKYLFGIYYQLL